VASYVIGDIQGCFKGLRKSLKAVQFDPSNDTLWSVGDMIARGDDSLSTLDLLCEMGSSFKPVLGNHDLNFLAIACGVRQPKPNDNLQPLLQSSALPRYVDWLRLQPLARKVDKKSLLVHAGLYPRWSINDCLQHADEFTKQLRSDSVVALLESMYGSKPRKWQTDLCAADRHRFTVNACTRMRFISSQGELDFECKEASSPTSTDLKPWFTVKNAQITKKQRVFFGHWAALNGVLDQKHFYGLDTGYVWGGALTMLRVEDMKLFSYKNQS
jgi:bis(5'-nucleosyl)-tetraphosphatase (symmetrical)